MTEKLQKLVNTFLRSDDDDRLLKLIFAKEDCFTRAQLLEMLSKGMQSMKVSNELCNQQQASRLLNLGRQLCQSFQEEEQDDDDDDDDDEEDDSEEEDDSDDDDDDNPPRPKLTLEKTRAFLEELLNRCIVAMDTTTDEDEEQALGVDQILSEGHALWNGFRIHKTFVDYALRGWLIVTMEDLKHQTAEEIAKVIHCTAKNPATSSSYAQAKVIYDLIQSGMHLLKCLQAKQGDRKNLQKHRKNIKILLQQDEQLKLQWENPSSPPIMVNICDSQGRQVEWIHPKWLIK